MRSGRLTKMEAARKSGSLRKIFEEGEAALGYRLFMVEGDDGLVGPGHRVEQIGAHNVGRPAQRLALQGDGVAGEARFNLPDLRAWCCILARSAGPSIGGVGGHTRRHHEPGRQPLAGLGERHLGVGLAGEGLVAQMSQSPLPDRLVTLRLALDGGPRAPRPAGCASRSSARVLVADQGVPGFTSGASRRGYSARHPSCPAVPARGPAPRWKFREPD